MPFISSYPNGDCAFNSVVLAGIDAIIAGKLDHDREAQKKWQDLFLQAGIITESNIDWATVKFFLIAMDSYEEQRELQIKIAPFLRKLTVDLAKKDQRKQYLEKTTQPFVAAFQSYVTKKIFGGDNPDDIFIASPDIEEYFFGKWETYKKSYKEQLEKNFNDEKIWQLINTDLTAEWQNYIMPIFLEHVGEAGKWVGDLELAMILPYLGFNFHYKNYDNSVTKYTEAPNKPALVFLNEQFHWYCETNTDFLKNPPPKAQAFRDDQAGFKIQLEWWQPCITAAKDFLTPKVYSYINMFISYYIDYKRSYPGEWLFQFQKYFTEYFFLLPAEEQRKIIHELGCTSLSDMVPHFWNICDFIEFYNFYESLKTDKNIPYQEFVAKIKDKNSSWEECVQMAYDFMAHSKAPADEGKRNFFIFQAQDFMAMIFLKRPLSLEESWRALKIGTFAWKSYDHPPSLAANLLSLYGRFRLCGTNRYFNSEEIGERQQDDFFSTLASEFSVTEYKEALANYSTFISLKDEASVCAMFSKEGKLLLNKENDYWKEFNNYLNSQSFDKKSAKDYSQVMATLWETTVRKVPVLHSWTVAMQLANNVWNKVSTEHKLLNENAKFAFLAFCQEKLVFIPDLNIKPDNMKRCWNAGYVALRAAYPNEPKQKPSYEKALQVFAAFFPSDKATSGFNWKLFGDKFKEIYTNTTSFAELFTQLRKFEFPSEATSILFSKDLKRNWEGEEKEDNKKQKVEGEQNNEQRNPDETNLNQKH